MTTTKHAPLKLFRRKKENLWARQNSTEAEFGLLGKGQKVVFHEAYHNKFRIARLRDQVPFSIGHRAFLYFSEFWTELGTGLKKSRLPNWQSERRKHFGRKWVLALAFSLPHMWWSFLSSFTKSAGLPFSWSGKKIWLMILNWFLDFRQSSQFATKWDRWVRSARVIMHESLSSLWWKKKVSNPEMECTSNWQECPSSKIVLGDMCGLYETVAFRLRLAFFSISQNVKPTAYTISKICSQKESSITFLLARSSFPSLAKCLREWLLENEPFLSRFFCGKEQRSRQREHRIRLFGPGPSIERPFPTFFTLFLPRMPKRSRRMEKKERWRGWKDLGGRKNSNSDVFHLALVSLFLFRYF